MTLSGTCLCGAVRYESSAEPLFSGNCYCIDCRRETGSGHLTVAAVPDDTLTITGTTTTFGKIGGSGREIRRTFCSTCGTTVFARLDAMPGMTMLRAGTLDDPTKVAPAMSIFTSHAQAWDRPDAALRHFAEMPPRR